MANDNKSLGRFKLPGIAPAPRGVPQIEVTFDIDANGIVSVSAKDLGTGKTQQVTITGGTALSEEDIEQMVKDAEAHANDDAKRKEAVEAKNQGDHTAYQIEKQLTEHGDKLTADERKPVDEKLATLKSLLAAENPDAEALKAATNDLLETSQILGQKIYEASAAEAAAANTAGEPQSDDEVVEAEVVEDDDES
jgi:molecular chaperone DnaK